MRPLVKLAGFVLALAAAAPSSAETFPPGSPYAARPEQPWPEQSVYQLPIAAPTDGRQVLPATYQAEVPRRGPTPADAGQVFKVPGAMQSDPPNRSRQPESLPLPPRGSSGGSTQAGPSKGGLPSAATVASSLAVVLGLFLVVAWALRRATPGEAALLPGEVVEVLGRKVISQRQQLQLLRCGRKLLLVSVTADAAETLTEITDPEEVDRLAGLCRQAQPGSATATFRQVMRQFSNERTEGRDV
jgi:flagellar biogenesis protein FliO